MAKKKSDFTLPMLDSLFSTQQEREYEMLDKIRDIPLELIDDFPDHPYKVKDDEDIGFKVTFAKRKILKNGLFKPFSRTCVWQGQKGLNPRHAVLEC